ncbi:Dihydromonapterin reductase [Carnimonas sp. R-84981]|uniref:dihydromonapterin reductase n=1 Tax=Carnimonas bestiolae TaxID=3402172 RepID=UPI003EDB93FB
MPQSPVLITGGAQRLGRYIAERLLDEGSPVIITYLRERDAVDAMRARGAIALQADFSSTAGIIDFIERLKGCTSRLRAIIHNASIWQPDSPDDIEQSAKAYEQMFRVHMQAPMLINTHCRELLLAGPEPLADIIHITDYSAAHGSRRHSAYASSKAGLANLAQSFATRYAPDIKVNSIAPASIMLNRGDDASYIEKLKRKSVLDVLPGPSAVWDSVRYLLDARFVTGTVLPVDGGRGVK